MGGPRRRIQAAALFPALLLLLLGLGAPRPATAQDAPGVRAALGTRAFAEPLFWLNATPPERLPIRDRPMAPELGLTALAPPFPARAGWAPWMGVGLEVNNSGESGDQILTLTPGVQYRYAGPRLRLDARYAVELALHGERGDLEDGLSAHGGQVALSYDISPRAQLSVFNIYSQGRDTREPRAVTGASETATVRSNAFVAGYRYAVSAREELDLGLSLRHVTIEGLGETRLRGLSLDAGYQWALSELTRLRLGTRYFEADFDGRATGRALAFDARLTHDLGPRWDAEMRAALVADIEDGSGVQPGFGLRLRHTERLARYALSAERSVVTVPGLSDFGVSDALSAQALWRVDRGMILDLDLGLQNLRALNESARQVRSVTLSGRLSYALDDRYWLWGRIDIAAETTDRSTERDARIAFGVSRDLHR